MIRSKSLNSLVTSNSYVVLRYRGKGIKTYSLNLESETMSIIMIQYLQLPRRERRNLTELFLCQRN